MDGEENQHRFPGVSWTVNTSLSAVVGPEPRTAGHAPRQSPRGWGTDTLMYEGAKHRCKGV
jgi:hypothetical protein